MIRHLLVRLAALAITVTFVVGPIAVKADGRDNPPAQDSVDLFQLPCVYPLISEDSVQVRQIIKPSAYDLTPAKVKRDFPIHYDLRNVYGFNWVTPVKSQSGGTCWTHGTMASLESSILRSGLDWIEYLPAQTYPCMDEYHLDWWNGFNTHYNADVIMPTTEGLTVHEGGDYLVSAAYLSRNDGAIDRYLTSGSLYTGTYSSPATYADPLYDYYYPREVEWLTAGSELENIDAIKEALQTHGAVATAICWSSSFWNSTRSTFYQPASSTLLPNHSVTIVGWDDTVTTQAPERGAWLCKNSWGTGWALSGYFRVSYYDKVAGHHPEMGAVAFRDVEIVGPREVYYHDYHGWRDTRDGCTQALNAFYAVNERMISDASFITAEDNVDYLVEVYDNFDPASGPSDLLASAQGTAAHIGLHTVALDHQIRFTAGDDFYLSLTLSGGGMAFDRTSLIPVLLGPEAPEEDALVRSNSAAGEGYYYESGAWHDLYDVDTTASFCIKALADILGPVGVSPAIGTAPLAVTFSTPWFDGEVLGCQWEFDDGTSSSELTPTHSFSELGIHNVTVAMTTSKGPLTVLHTRAFAVHTDTMTVTSVAVDVGQQAKVDVVLHNYLPVDRIMIPFNWDGPLDLVYDSVSVAGCRTGGFGSVVTTGPVAPGRAAALIWESDQNTPLQAGTGPVASIYFTVTGGSNGEVNPVKLARYSVVNPELFCVGFTGYQPTLVDGQIEIGCCDGRVGDANDSGEDEPTIGDVSKIIDALFITGIPAELPCLSEADVNQSGGANPTVDDITIGDISMLIDYLFITGSSLGLADCL